MYNYIEKLIGIVFIMFLTLVMIFLITIQTTGNESYIEYKQNKSEVSNG